MDITRQQLQLESGSSPLMTREVLQFRQKKKFSDWDIVFLVDVYKMRGCLCIFVYIWKTSSSPGSRPIEPILWVKVFLDSRLQNESLEVLTDFLAFLVQTSWQNKQKLIREIPTNRLGRA